MSRVVFLLEELSMKVFLDGFLPRHFPSLQFLCVPHEGKQDLEQSIPRKLKGWSEPGVRFFVLRDNDGAKCRDLKMRLVSLCESARPPNAIIRLVCQELEAWYFGEPGALAAAFDDPSLGDLGAKARYRDPDAIVQPANELAVLAPSFQKVSGARLMASKLGRTGNSSQSFRVFMRSVAQLCAEFGHALPRS